MDIETSETRKILSSNLHKDKFDDIDKNINAHSTIKTLEDYGTSYLDCSDALLLVAMNDSFISFY